MNDITALAQRMKAAAEKATPGEWRAFTHPASGTYAVHTPKDKRCEDVIKWPGFDGRKNAGANANFVATANPANVLALVEALEKAQQYAKERDEENQELMLTVGRLRTEREALESRTVTVKLPELHVGVVQSGHAVMVPYPAGHWFNKTAILEMLTAAGIQVIEGEGQ